MKTLPSTTSTKQNSGSISSREESYRLAKLIRAGSRELSRQYNTKRSKRPR